MTENTAMAALRHHVSGAVERGEAEPIVAIEAIEPTTVELTGWGTFEECRNSILALLFGAMVRTTHDVVKEYHSDLFHDAQWLREYVTDETTFMWMVRASGTNIGESATIARDIGAPGGVLYRIHLHTRDHKPSGFWVADFIEEWRA